MWKSLERDFERICLPDFAHPAQVLVRARTVVSAIPPPAVDTLVDPDAPVSLAIASWKPSIPYTQALIVAGNALILSSRSELTAMTSSSSLPLETIVTSTLWMAK